MSNENNPISQELQQELERQIRNMCNIMHERPMDADEKYFDPIGYKMYLAAKTAALSDIAKRIHTQGMMPCKWTDHNNPPDPQDKNDPWFSERVLVLLETNRVDIASYDHSEKCWSKQTVIKWMPLPDTNSPTVGYISIEEHERLMNSLGELLDGLPENMPLYKDSGLWQQRSDDMEEVLFRQGVNETTRDFIKRIQG